MKELRERNGLLRWLVEADPESGGLLRAGLDGHTARGRQVRFTTDGDADEDDPLFDNDVADTRTPAQRRLDALIAMAIASLRADDGDVSGIAATVAPGGGRWAALVHPAALGRRLQTATTSGPGSPARLSRWPGRPVDNALRAEDRWACWPAGGA